MEQDILEYAASLQCQELHMALDEATGLKSIIAIHSTALGPALGGCRCIEYPSTYLAVVDAIRLAQGMAYKAAISNLPLGGGKMVILKPKTIRDRVAFFQAVGMAVDNLNGRYITAVDSGTSIEDMDIVATTTHHVTSTSHPPAQFSIADPSIMTAEGVLRGIQAAVRYKLGRDSLQGIHIAIQGLGHAGYALAQKLYEQGARLSVYDIKPDLVAKAVQEFKATAISSLDVLMGLDCDVFAPNALGAVLNDNTIPKLRASIVAGCANNQLEAFHHGAELNRRSILYVPDYVVNAGGLIYVAAQFSHITEREAKDKINGIYDTLIKIFERSENESRPTNEVADLIAREKLYRA